ncbi:hypothetical protein GCM10009677_04590 [Sphaerisporangium rubeum]|uniref:Uncharacterized protein n=1 Tax=Sphaerisporangium rubeum TaxID=321317 RepID=A0A7X0I8S0_9ACTN|nr:hypothetical protein [Sphaerisporangium rubeum]MBB6470700.1 hypothetical protein [Sphaerisporangium rubeum]
MRESPAAVRHPLLSVRLDEMNRLDELDEFDECDEHRPTVLASAPPSPPGWSVFRSDTGRYWATRRRFREADEAAGVWRTVDADDPVTLTRLIAEQEHRAGATS